MASRFFMAASVLIGMGAGLVVFVVLARALGPVGFGLVSTVFVYAGLAALLTDFGFSLKMLRDIAADPERGGAIIAASLSVKGLLTAIVLLIGLIVLAVLPLGVPEKMAVAMLGAGILIGSIGDLGIIAFRSVGRFSDETRITAWTSAMHGAIVIPIALLSGDVTAVGAGFLLSRAIYVWVTLANLQRLFPHDRIRLVDASTTLSSMRQSVSWALDSGLSYVNGQVDGMVILPVLGLASAGIYQSGARFVQPALTMVAVLSNVHIAAIAAQPPSNRLSRREWRMMAEFVALGGTLALFFILGGPVIERTLLGPKYVEVNHLWLGFAAFLFMRYVAASFGASLAALGRPALRIAGQIVGTSTLLAGFLLVLPRVGLIGAPWIMMCGSAATLGVYAVGRLRWIRVG
jgi:O-antigen/teichoic acid export membrane protein